LESGAATLSGKASELTDDLTLDFRVVFVLPVDTAEELSETMMVTRSYTWLARTSRKPSAKRPFVE
jgi:hypothetical protein